MNDSVNQRRKGAVLSYLSLVVNAIASFIYVPLLLGFLTTEEYGVYELVGSIIAYLSVMDMGLSTTLNRFYVKSSVSQSKEKTENLLAMAAVVYLFLTFLAVGASLLIYASLGTVFGSSFSEEELALAHHMMFLVMANCVIVLPGNWFLAIINANERFIFARSLSIVKYTMQVITTLLILNIHSSALIVLGVQVAANVLVVVAYAVYCFTRLKVSCRLHRWDWRLLWSMFAFSSFILLNMVFDQVFWRTGQVVLGAVSGAAAVAVYGIACKIITAAYMQLSVGVSSVFLPRITAISATTKNMKEIDSIFCKVGRIQAILVWGVIAAFAVLGPDFVALWAGPDFASVYPVTLILMLGLSISLIQNVGILVLQATNRMGFRSLVYIALAALDVVISIPVSAKFGVVGCAIVAAILLFVGTGPVMNWYYSKHTRLDIPRFYREVIPLLVPAAGAGIVTALVLATVGPSLSWLSFAWESLIFVGVYALLLWLVGFNRYEKGIVLSVVSRLKMTRHT